MPRNRAYQVAAIEPKTQKKSKGKQKLNPPLLPQIPQPSQKLPPHPNDRNVALIAKMEKAAPLFLREYSHTMHYANSLATCGLLRSDVTRYMELSPEFRAALQRARGEALTVLEDAAIERAVIGIDRDVYYKGEVVGTQKEYSDAMLAMLMRGADPARYAKHTTELSGLDGGPIATANLNINADASVDDIAALYTGMLKAKL
jgi:hypothetical protein